MRNRRKQPRGICNPRQTSFLSCLRLRMTWLARGFVVALLTVFSLTGIAHAQEQSAPQPQPQPQAQPKSQPQPQSQPQPRKTVASAAAASRTAKSKQDQSGPHKVYTDRDMATLPPGGISVGGPPAPTPIVANLNAKPADDTTRVAAYWKARFTAARRKLAQDRKALPALQTQLEVERVQQESVDEDTGQVNSDTYMDLLHQIDSMKVTIRNDNQALSDLHDEFRHAGGLPGWIR